MEENKPQNIASGANTTPTSSGVIDFDKLLITGKEEPKLEKKPEPDKKLEQTVPSVSSNMFSSVPPPKTEGVSLLSQANIAMKEQPKTIAVDISNIQIEDLSREKEKHEKISLGGNAPAPLVHAEPVGTGKVFRIATIVIVVCVLLSGISYLRGKYLGVIDHPLIDPAYQTYVDHIRDYEKFWSEYTQLNDYFLMSSASFVDKDGSANVHKVLDTDRLWYDQRKDLLQNGLSLLVGDIVNNFNALNLLKEDVSRYGFLPKELFAIFDKEPQDVSIKSSLLSLEVVKFSAAIKVFSYLDSFIQGLANVLNIDPTIVQAQMKTFDQTVEKDIKLYLNDCYLNPFEIDFDCNLVSDFDTYYSLFEKDSTLDRNFFKKMMYYIDLKLEQSDYPNLGLVFQSFNSKQKEISFNATVNTFKQDEVSLIKQGILSPHIFVVTQLLNLLKQSLFVIGENIDAKQLKVQSRLIPVGSSTLTANTSYMSFVLPIQKNPQREIADFISNKTSSFLSGIQDALIPTILPQVLPETGKQIILKTGAILTGGIIPASGQIASGVVIQPNSVGIIN